MTKVILSVIDSHGDTWLYPFTSNIMADDALEALSDRAGDELQLEVIPLELPKSKSEILEEWEDQLEGETSKKLRNNSPEWFKELEDVAHSTIEANVLYMPFNEPSKKEQADD